ncbi:MAG: teichoic acid biosynthesis protein, partial [Longicatena sp.]|nr:teichoic acid biosynthesis protein [Longicatena sp.]
MTQAIATIIVTCVENKWMRQTFESLEPCRNVDVIVLSKVDLEIPEFVKKVIKTSCFATTYNELLETIETPYTLFMHEGDAISTQFVEQCAYVLEGVTSLRPSIKKWKHKYYKLRPSERDVKDAPFIAPKSYCISPLLNKAKKQHNLSSNYIQGVYGIDITNDDFALHTSLAGTLIRTHILKQYRFNPDIYFEYEMDVLLRMLMDYSYYIVTNEAEFHYFDPRENDALFHIPAHYPQWYHDSIKNYLLPLIKDYIDKPKTNIFLQNYIVYYLMCRLLTNLDNRNKKQINDENRDEYLSLIQQILSYVSDSVLLNEVNLSYQTSNPELKLLLLRLKNLNQPIQYDYIEEVNDKNETDLVMKYNDVPISNLGKHRFVINVMNYIDGRIELDGSLISIFQYGGIDYYAKFEDEYVKVEDTDAYSLTKYFGVPAYRRLTYHLSFPLKDKDIQRISFYVKYQGKMYPMKMDFGNHWAKLSKSPRYSYWKFNKYFAHHGDNAIVIRKANFFNIFKREIQFQLNLIKIDKKESFKALRFRWLYWLTRPYFKNKKIWLMLDKLYKGGDSAEYLYRYSAKLNDGVTRYYLINENTKEYAELKKDGYKPLKNGSLMHKLVFLNADLILITNSHLFPFNGYTKATSK